jgi:hypothetical protein
MSVRSQALSAIVAVSLTIPFCGDFAHSQPGCDQFCQESRKLLDSRSSNFAALKTQSGGSGSSWPAKTTLPGSSECYVNARQDSEKKAQYTYGCFMSRRNLPTDEAIRRNDELIGQIKSALPPGLVTETQARGALFFVKTERGGDVVVSVTRDLRLGIISLTVWGPAP